MKPSDAKRIMQIEKECARRQKGTECPRNCHPEYGCYGCDLLQDNPDKILEAYDLAIQALDVCISDVWGEEE